MRVLFFAGGSYVGGMEAVTLTLMKSLIEAGHPAAAVVSGWNDGVYPGQLAQAGVPYREIKLGRLYRSKPLWTLDSIVNFPMAAIALRRFVREFQPDVLVHVDIHMALVAMTALHSGIPNVFHLHNAPNQSFQGPVARYVLGKCAGCIAVSKFVASQLPSVRVKVQTIYNGVEIPQLYMKPNFEKVRIGIVGQLLERKRHDVLVNALGRLPLEMRQKIEVRVYGSNDTEFAEDIRALAAERTLGEMIRWMGFVESRSEIYATLDVVVAPAVSEPFGMTVLEAGAYCVPVIAARSGGFPETVIEGKTGLMFNPDDIDDLYDCILRLYKSADLRSTLGANGRAHVVSTFSEAKMTQNFVDALGQFLGVIGSERKSR